MSSTIELPSLGDTFGCLFMGGILSTALWGVACAQLYFYYENYSKTDKAWLRAYLFLIFLLDTAHQALLVQSLYFYLIKEFGNFLNLTRPQGALIDVTMFAALIDSMVQSVFLVRVWTLSKGNYILTGALAITILGLLAATLTFYGQTYGITDADHLRRSMTTARVMHSLVVLSDTSIAVALIVLLWRVRSGIRKTDTVIKRLVVYTIGTGLITSAWAIVGLVGSIAMPNTFMYLMVDVVIPKLYFNCVLASLNSRSKLRGELADASGAFSIRLDNVRTGADGSSSSMSNENRCKPAVIECKVDVEVGHDPRRQLVADRSRC